ncbi:MAG: mechanosensitive ion channel family protein [Chloroflexota bacterium]
MLSALQGLIAQLISNAPQFLVAIAILVATLLLSKVAERWAQRSVRRKITDPETRRFLTQTTRYTVLVLGILAALDQVPGVPITSFLAGLGIVGFTVGFALQDIARNFIAGLLLLMRQPFAVGDAVEVAGRGGIVMEITMRDTVIKSWEGVIEIIPNLDVYSNPIVNYSQLPLRRRTVTLGLGYGQDIARAKRIILDVIQSTEGVLDDPAPEVLTEQLGDAALDVAARFWVNQKTHSPFAVHSNVVDAINAVAEEESIDMPYPTQVVQLEAELPFESPLG